jgi:predicted RNA-binding Zn-ribbon protein involved in translation (DUF1610 family)
MKKLNGVRDVFKNTKHKKITTIYCPKCASKKIHIYNSLSYGFTTKLYLCDECGYNGPIIMELEKVEEAENKEE